MKGLVTGVVIVVALVLLILVFRFFQERDRKIYEYMEVQREVQGLREDIGNRPLDEFLEDPGVRGAADSATGEFEQRRDEILQRFRGRIAD
jgi:hypothetical protein